MSKPSSRALTRAPVHGELGGGGAVTRLRRHAHLLRPGLFFTTKGTVYRHWRQALPAHLRATKGALEPGPANAGWLRKLWHRLRVARCFYNTGGTGAHSIVILGSLGDEILLDPIGQTVTRVVPAGSISDAQLTLRAQWSAYVPSPSFQMHRGVNGGDLLRESFVEGLYLLDLDLDEQVRQFEHIVGYFGALAAHMPSGPAAPIVERCVDDQVVRALHPVLRALIDPPRLRRLARSWVLTSAYADCHAGNIVVPKGGRAVFIDCLPLMDKPFFYTPLYMLIRSPELAPLRRLYFDGALDPSMTALFKVRGLDFPADKRERRMLLALTLLLRACGRDEAKPPSDLARIANWFLERAGMDRAEAW